MKETLLPEAKNDFLFTIIGNKTEFIIFIGVFLAAAALWKLFGKK